MSNTPTHEGEMERNEDGIPTVATGIVCANCAWGRVGGGDLLECWALDLNAEGPLPIVRRIGTCWRWLGADGSTPADELKRAAAEAKAAAVAKAQDFQRPALKSWFRWQTDGAHIWLAKRETSGLFAVWQPLAMVTRETAQSVASNHGALKDD